jgi:hypothetical protein
MSATGTYLDMNLYTSGGAYNPYFYLIDLFWLLIICWISWSLGIKKQDIRLSIVLVGIVIMGYNTSDYLDYGLSNSLYAYITEGLIYVVMLILLNKPSAKEWCSNKIT